MEPIDRFTALVPLVKLIRSYEEADCSWTPWWRSSTWRSSVLFPPLASEWGWCSRKSRYWKLLYPSWKNILICAWQFQETGGAALLIFQGIATGSLLYVVFFEILEKERVKDVNGFAQAVSMCFGYTLLVLLTMLEPQVRQIVISYIRSLSLMTLILW